MLCFCRIFTGSTGPRPFLFGAFELPPAPAYGDRNSFENFDPVGQSKVFASVVSDSLPPLLDNDVRVSRPEHMSSALVHRGHEDEGLGSGTQAGSRVFLNVSAESILDWCAGHSTEGGSRSFSPKRRVQVSLGSRFPFRRASPLSNPQERRSDKSIVGGRTLDVAGNAGVGSKLR